MRTSVGYETPGSGKPLSTVCLISETGNFIRITENEYGSFVIEAKDPKFHFGKGCELVLETEKIHPDTELAGD